jgi:predicted AAA+ superfamily ATPase
MRIFRRNIISKLEAWKQDKKHKPLILRGARQVGKTTVVNEFGSQFDNYLYFNLERNENAKLFEMEIPLDDLVNMLYASVGKVKKEGTTLVFIDEIQNSPKTIALLRYFYEQRSDLYVIAAGSLLENLVDVKVSFPVGRVQYLALRPCSFSEFLGAIGKNNLLAVLSQKAEYTVAFHEQLMHLFNQYTIVGGMPEAVQQYAETQDVIGIEDVYETLVQAYKDDSEKYVRGNKLTDVVRFILSYGWAFSGETITLGNFANSGYKSREVGEAFRLLEKAMLLELIYPVSSTQLPIIPETKRMPKLIWFDTGLVNYQAGIRKEIIGSTDMVDSWRGHIAEQITAQELLTLDDRVGQHRSFWAKPNNGAEVDFIFAHNSKLYPIEVKSGTNAHLRSLQVFMDSSGVNIAIRIWSKPYSVDKVKTIHGKEFTLINLPFYLIGNLRSVLDAVVEE